MAKYNYYASPKDSARALAFQEAWDNATPGQDFMFEGQPYAGPSGLLAPEQQVQQYFQPPPGGWTGGVDPNVFAAQTPAVSSRSGNMRGPVYQGKDSDYYTQNFFRKFPINPLTGEPDYGGDILGSRNMGLVQSTDPSNFGDLIPDPSTDPAGTRIAFDDPRIAGTQIPFPEQSTPSYLAQNRDSVQYQPGFQNIITGGSRPQQGLLGPGYAGQNRTEVEELRQQVAQGRVPQQSRILANTDEHGWTKDRRMRDANLQVANMLLNYGEQSRNDDGWDSELTHY